MDDIAFVLRIFFISQVIDKTLLIKLFIDYFSNEYYTGWPFNFIIINWKNGNL